jgi:hypothetical protein
VSQNIHSEYPINDTDCLLFPEKEAKSVVPLRGRPFHTKNSAKSILGGWWLALKKTVDLIVIIHGVFFFVF